MRFSILLVSAVLSVVPCNFVSGVDFNRDIRPLLSDRCFACHGPDANHREADLRLDQLDSVLEDRGGYQVIKPGKADASELILRIESNDEDLVMPPHDFGKPLDDSEKRLLRDWIASGAEWNEHWAYVQPKSSVPPDVSDRVAAPLQSWIDAYVVESLAQAGGRLSARAKTVTLARRLSFDLIGLPPAPRDVENLLEAKDPDLAIREYVDQLLASPEFGEHLATYWLDLVRYADTVGYHGDQDHNTSPYRNYVIDAFNDNMPFDRFTIEQLAGDLLADPTDEQQLATAYNRLLQTSHEGGVQPKEYLAIYQADRVRNVSAVWMGATVGCAQCHDHKYDPYTAKDFYSLAAFFADIDEAQHFKVGSNSLPTKRPPERAFLSRAQQVQLEILEAARAKESDAKTISALDARAESLKKSAAVAMYTKSIEPRVVRYLPRGDWLDDSGEIVQPGTPAFMSGINKSSRASRLDLAQWLTDSENGAGLLTARVMVNRFWMRLFGKGISRSVEDFGGQGEPPTHPELLDRLAIEFVDSGWDVKHVFRLLVNSSTYQQSSETNTWQQAHDPENRLWSRQNRFRLPAEVVRDTALESSGMLVKQIGGLSVKPFQPSGYYRHLNFPTRKYKASSGASLWRRGLYIHWQRQFLHPMLKAFDAPSREECTAQRPQSNTPLAALVLLNDETFLTAADGLARRVSASADRDVESKITLMFSLVTSRQPDTSEMEVLRDLHAAALEEVAARSSAKQTLEARSGEADESEALTMVARAILNLSEAYSRE